MRISDWSSDVCSSDLLWRCVSMTDRNQSCRPVCRPPGTGRSICPAPLRRSHPDASSDQSRAARTSGDASPRSEEHTSELQSLMRISYAVFCLTKKSIVKTYTIHPTHLLRAHTLNNHI